MSQGDPLHRHFSPNMSFLFGESGERMWNSVERLLSGFFSINLFLPGGREVAGQPCGGNKKPLKTEGQKAFLCSA